MMRKTMMILLTLVWLAVGMSAQTTYVITAGVSHYGNPDISNLSMPAKDAQEVALVFKKQGATVGTLTGKHVTIAKLRKKINAAVSLAKANDMIVLYLSGHGAPGRFVCYNGELLAYDQLANMLSAAKTSKVFVFVDACFSGSAQSAVGSHSDLSGVKPVFCMASRPDEVSWERGVVIDNGLFTQALLKGLRGKADYNGDRKVTLLEVFKYVYNDVTAKTKGKEVQHPQLIGNSALFNTVITRW